MPEKKKKYISDKEEAFEKIDIIYNKIKYHKQEKMKNRVQVKDIWQELYEAIPYRFILGNKEILYLIVDLCENNYEENLSLLKSLISDFGKENYNYSVKDVVRERNENNIKKNLEVNKVFNILNKETSISNGRQYDVKEQLKKSENISNQEKNRNVTVYEEDKLLYESHRVSEDLLPNRKVIKLGKIVRNLNVVLLLKKLYKNTCQLCSTRLEIAPNEYYSEVHHIRLLGDPHRGSDTMDNTIVLCPNCHKLFDRGSLGIDVETSSIVSFNKNHKLNGIKITIKHEINPNNLKYHNNNIYIYIYINNKCNHKINDVEKNR